MGQWNGSAAKDACHEPVNQSLVPGIHTVEGKNRLENLFWVPHMSRGTRMHINKQTNK